MGWKGEGVGKYPTPISHFFQRSMMGEGKYLEYTVEDNLVPYPTSSKLHRDGNHKE
jgi:hypothetical protein